MNDKPRSINQASRLALRLPLLSLFALLALVAVKLPAAVPVHASHSGNVIFVDDSAAGTERDGSSWERAYTNLQLALAHARDGDEIWVAAGTYRPTARTERALSFQLKSGVAIYGGFAATETLRSQRDWSANVTILSGDIGTRDSNRDNSLHVVRVTDVDASTVLDGFTITRGNANLSSPNSSDERGGGIRIVNASPTLANLILTDNHASQRGGGIDVETTTGHPSPANPTLRDVSFLQNSVSVGNGGALALEESQASLTNVTFSANEAHQFGGGMYNELSNPVLVAVTFSDNEAVRGGGMYNFDSSARLTNVTFIDNRADGQGGGMYNYRSHPASSNVLFSGNSAILGGGIHNFYSDPVIANTTFRGNEAQSGGGTYNLESSPTFTGVLFLENLASRGGGLYSESSGPTLVNVTFRANTAFELGGGIFNDLSSAALLNVTLSGNSAKQGGGMYTFMSGSRFTNVLLSGNTASGSGGGMFAASGSSTLTNVTFSGNTARTAGGGMYTSSASTVRNSILWGNRPDQIAANGGASVQYSLVEGGFSGQGNKNADPRFVDDDGPDNDAGTSDDDLRLRSTSPAIDAGNNGAVPADARDLDGDQNTREKLPLDLAGNPRFVDRPGMPDSGVGPPPVVDMGAYESVAMTWYVDDSATGGNNGTSWVHASTNLQDALGSAGGGDEIWVAGGFYTPTAASDRTISFQLANGVAIYGGFTGGETSRDQRNATANPTILSGDIGAPGNSADNSFHVVNGSGTDATTILDGFTITGGNADGASPHNDGGGMLVTGGSPTLANITFRENAAQRGGGLFNAAGGSPALTDVTFISNTASSIGGGMFNQGSSPSLRNITFHANRSADGGGMANSSGNPTLTNATFSNNTASDDGGGMLNAISQPVLAGVAFIANSAGDAGGGMLNGAGSNATIVDATFNGNHAALGGGMLNDDSSPSIANAVFSGNSASDAGGGMLNGQESAPLLANVTFSANSASRQGSGIHNRTASHAVARNAILWGNLPEQVANADSAGATVEYSLVQGGHAGAGNVDGDPAFLNAAGADQTLGTLDDDLRLRSISPAIDAGNNSAVPTDLLDLDGDGDTSEPLPRDRGGNPRFVDHPVPNRGAGSAPIVDMGAFETLPPILVDDSATGNDDGSTWADAHTDLQAALARAASGGELWVAAGIYAPVDGPTRTIAFQLESGVAIYGGFAGGETSRDQRNVAANPTILSGDIGTPGNSADNSFHVVTAAGTDATAILDGFTITGGNADGLNLDDRGGGVLIAGGSPTLENLTFRENAARRGGGLSNGAGGSPALANVAFLSNTASLVGGGIFNQGTLRLDAVTLASNAARDGAAISNAPAATLQGTRLRLTGNRAGRDGGGIHNSRAALMLEGSTLRGNTTVRSGGGLFNDGQATLAATTLAANAARNGGALFNAASDPASGRSSVLFLTNSTVSANQASLSGGGLFNRGQATLSSATLVFNSAVSNTDGSGGGIHNDGGTVTIKNTILAGNSDPHRNATARRPDCAGTLRSEDYNLVQNLQGCRLTGAGDHNKTGIDPQLAPLQNNGGPTLTHALATRSPAIDAGKPAGCTAGNGDLLATDQRGQPRHRGAACDIGAFERAPRRSVGISELAPSSGGSEPGVLVSFTLTWTHPVSWRQLETIDLRFGSAHGSLFAVRFTEDLTSTFSLLDEEGEVVGTAPAHSDAVLQTESGTLDVARSGFQASGPTDPSVVVTFTLSFTQAAAGQTYTIELLASDDEGQIEGPDPAGSWRVGVAPRPIYLPSIKR